MTSVANHPGTSGFMTQEYGNFTEFVESVVPCTVTTTAAPTVVVPCAVATTGAPTIQAPTTEVLTPEALPKEY